MVFGLLHADRQMSGNHVVGSVVVSVCVLPEVVEPVVLLTDVDDDESLPL